MRMLRTRKLLAATLAALACPALSAPAMASGCANAGEEGREMRCQDVQQAISYRDGRTLWSRRLRAHLREYESCRRFKAGVRRRPRALARASPPLTPAVAARVLRKVLAAGCAPPSSGPSAR